MFVEVNRNKEVQKVKYYLAKPNRDVIAHLYEKKDDNISLKLGNTHELKFSIPFYIDGESNEHIDMIKEKMLIKMVLGTQVEWFIIDEIQEDGSDEQTYNITCFSLGYELSHKRIGEYEGVAVSLKQYLADILEGTQWKLRAGGVHSKFEGLQRSISLSETNSLDALFQGAETFGALIIWDTIRREVYFEDLETYGKFKGMSVNYGHLLNSLSKNRTSEELTTRLYVGNDELSIHRINPTGQPYLEDFSYFLYPFQRDGNKKVIKSSHFMSDELANAILDYENLILTVTPRSRELQDLKVVCLAEFSAVEQEMFKLNLELESILTRLDVAKATGNESLISQITIELTNKNSEIATKKTLFDTKKANLVNVEIQLENFYNSILTESSFTPKLLNELSFYIIEKEWRDDRYLDAQELYDDGVKKFKEIRTPKVVLTIDVNNLFEMIEEQYYWDKLVLGDMIKIKYPQMKLEYMAKIMEINLNIEDGGISLTIANTIDLGSDEDKLAQMLYKSSTASTLIQNNKHKWDKVANIEDEVLLLLNSEWDANKNRITAGVNNDVVLSKRGLTVTNPDYPNEVVIMQSGIVALSKDGGDTWKSAITADGVIAERLIGNVIIGRNLIMTNQNNLFTFDADGVVIDANAFKVKSSSGGNLLDNWNNAEKNSKDYTDTVKNTVNAEVSEVVASLGALENEIKTTFADGLISEAEAISIKKYINTLNNEKSDVDSRYNFIYGDIQLTGTPKTTLNTRKIAYNTAHSNLLLSIDTAIFDKLTTLAESLDVDNKFALYKTALSSLSTAFEDAINTIAQAKATKAKTDANTYTNDAINLVKIEIDDVDRRVDDFELVVNTTFKDGVIDIAEKEALNTHIEQLNNEKADVDAKYTKIYASTYLTGTTKTNLYNSKAHTTSGYDTIHRNLITTINTVIGDGIVTEVEKTAVASSFSAYRASLSSLSNALEDAIRLIETAKINELKANEIDPLKVRVNTAELKITNEAIVSTVTSSSAWDTQSSKINQTSDKVSIVVSGTNQINGSAIASSITTIPSAIALISDSINLTGKVTFSSLDTATANRVITGETANSTVNSWKAVGKTTINGANIETGTISANRIKVDELFVGTGGIRMDATASISWGNVTSKPSIPNKASDVGAISSTFIDANNVWTGNLNADKITTGSLSASRINGGTISGQTITGGSISGVTISGGSISVTTDIAVGNNITLGGGNYLSNKKIVLSSSAGMYYYGGTLGYLEISAAGGVEVHELKTMGHVNFSNATGINWGSHAPNTTAKFG